MRRTNGFTLRNFGYIVVMLVVAGCSAHPTSPESLPPGMVYLMQAPVGRDFEAFVEESTIASKMRQSPIL